MKGRDWLVGSLAAAAAVTLFVAPGVRAEDRHFTRQPLDINRNEKIVYAPVLFAGLGPRPVDDIPGIRTSWDNFTLFEEDFGGDRWQRGQYRLVSLTVSQDPDRPSTEPPEVDIVIERDMELNVDAPAPEIVLIDQRTALETRARAEVFSEAGRTLYRVELLPPRAAMTPPGYRVYLNPNDRYELQVLGGTRELVAGMRQTLPTFGQFDPRNENTVPRRRRRR
jgi:hypothetical protein